MRDEWGTAGGSVAAGRGFGLGLALLVGDEGGWLLEAATWLRQGGFEPRCSSTRTGVTFIEDTRPDAIILGLRRVDETTAALCASLRARTRAGIIVTAFVDRPDITPRLLDAGADAVIDRPTTQRVLIARLRALLRRIPRERRLEGEIRYGDLTLDLYGHVLRVGAHEIVLDAREQRMVEALVAATGGAVTRAELADVSRSSIDEVEHLVRRLRQRLEEHERWRRIVSVRGVGFRLLEAPPTMADRGTGQVLFRPGPRPVLAG